MYEVRRNMKGLVFALALVVVAVSTVDAGFVDRLKCKGCLSLAPFAGSSVCSSKCGKKNIFPETCTKICDWMISRHPETVCRVAKLCTLDVIKELKSGGLLSLFGLDEDEGYDTGNEENDMDDARRLVKSRRLGVCSRCRPGWPCSAFCDELDEENDMDDARRLVKSRRLGACSRCRPGWPCSAFCDELDEENDMDDESRLLNSYLE